MIFRHDERIWTRHPGLGAGALHAEGMTASADVSARIAPFLDIARQRLAGRTESELPEIQAWRRAFSGMGLKPTQYRCASEALLRRFRQDGALPTIHPVIDLCNAVSLAFAIPVAVFDTAKISGDLAVRPAEGNETYLTFGGETETPEPGEIIFADGLGRAHARRWTNRQSALSAIRSETAGVLIVAEALHDGAVADVERLLGAVAAELDAVWSLPSRRAMLSAAAPDFGFPGASD